MMDVLKIAIEISPILFMAAAIVCIPLLSDGPPQHCSKSNEQDRATTSPAPVNGFARTQRLGG